MVNWTFAAIAIPLGLIVIAMGMGWIGKVKRKDAFKVGGIALLALGFLMGGLSDWGVDLGDQDGALSIGDISGVDDSDISGICSSSKTIESLTMNAKTAGSNSYTTASGDLDFYEQGTDVTDPNANPIDSLSLSSGTVTDTGKLLQTCVPYEFVFDGEGTYYSIDFGEMYFDVDSLSSETGQLNYPTFEVQTIGSISDVLDETATDGTINGQSNVSDSGTNEIDTAGTEDNPLVYDISVGDGSFYIDIDIGCEGSNEYCNDMIMDFIWEDGARPEGNEISSITAQLRSGTDLGIPSEIVNYWANERAVEIGDMTGGQSATYRLTFSVSESNLDANDDWKFCIDDLGGYAENDVGFDDGLTGQCVDFDAQA